MTMNCKEFSIRWLDCLEEGVEPRDGSALREHLDRCPACREEALDLERLWRRLPEADPALTAAPAPSARLSARMRRRFRASLAAVLEASEEGGEPIPFSERPEASELLEPSEAGGRLLRGPWHRGLGFALAATLAVGAGLGFLLGSGVGARNEVGELRAEMRQVTEAVSIALMDHQAASERLRGIALADGELTRDEPDHGPVASARVIEALFERLRQDPNDNVRLAAVEALAAAIDRPDVREGLAGCLGDQESPQVQAVVLEALARADRSYVDRALSSEALDDDVRQWFLAVAPSSIG